jgi:hypothetical protein
MPLYGPSSKDLTGRSNPEAPDEAGFPLRYNKQQGRCSLQPDQVPHRSFYTAFDIFQS